MEKAVSAIIWTLAGFAAGAMPFSVWLGRLFLHADIRKRGDGNPGTANAWRAGGWRIGVPTLLLDYLKGAVPVGVAHFTCGLSGWELLPVSLAPVAGHAFSPFLRFRGGKAVAVTFGIWTGLTLGDAPIVLGILLGLFNMTQTADAWAVMLGMTGLLVHLLVQRADPILLVVWCGNMLILAWKHRSALRQIPRPRSWVFNLLRRVG